MQKPAVTEMMSAERQSCTRFLRSLEINVSTFRKAESEFSFGDESQRPQLQGDHNLIKKGGIVYQNKIYNVYTSSWPVNKLCKRIQKAKLPKVIRTSLAPGKQIIMSQQLIASKNDSRYFLTISLVLEHYNINCRHN